MKMQKTLLLAVLLFVSACTGAAETDSEPEPEPTDEGAIADAGAHDLDAGGVGEPGPGEPEPGEPEPGEPEPGEPEPGEPEPAEPEPGEPEPGEPEPGEPEPGEPEPSPEPSEPEPSPEPGVSAGCGSLPTAGETVTLQHDGTAREYKVHLPEGYDQDTPHAVVFSFHGRTLSAWSQQTASGFNDLADEEGFIVIYPEGTGDEPTWNAGGCCGDAMQNDVDDVGFTSAIIDDIKARACVDDTRVYATGLSNGAYMSYRLACMLSDRITAIGAVAGTTLTVPCAPPRPVPVLHFHGTDDQIVQYEGELFSGSLSAPGNADDWREKNGCSATKETTFNVDDVVCEAFTDCDADASVELCTVDGGGHQWPGGGTLFEFLLGPNTDTIDASAHMWAFFQRYSL